MSLTPDQQRAVCAEEKVLFVSAGAGSGKTKVLVERYVRCVAELGVPTGQAAAVTFTRKAAGELRHRIRSRFVEMGRSDLAQGMDRAPIGTIHSLCSRILRSEGLIMGLHPGFRVLEEDEAEILIRDSLTAAREEVAAQAAAAELEVLARHRTMLEEQVLAAFRSMRAAGQRVPRLGVPPCGDAGRARAVLEAALEDVCTLSPAELPNATAAGNYAKAGECLQWLATIPSVHPATICRAGAYVPAMRGDKVKALFGEQRDALVAWCRVMGEEYLARVAVVASTLLDRFVGIYAALKAEREALDFADLEIEAISLLESSGRRSREPLYLLVDEFQDTNLLQCRLFDLLAPVSFTSVGDYFQSIYSFRGADCTVFQRRRDQLRAGEGEGLDFGRHRVGGSGTSACISLATSFRTAEPVLTAINRLFGHEAFFGVSYVPLEPCSTRHVDRERGRLDPAVELHVVDVPRSSDLDRGEGGELAEGAEGAMMGPIGGFADEGEVAQAPFPEALYVGARVKCLVEEEGWRPGQIVILLRKTVRSGEYAQALQRLGIGSYVVGGRGYFSQLEVTDVMSFLTLLLDPHDDLALATALRSPLARVSDDALWLLGRVRREQGLMSLWEAVRAPDRELLATQDERQLECLCTAVRDLCGRVGGPGMSGLIDEAVSSLDYDLSLLSAPEGRRRFANVRKLMELADVFEEMEGPDLAGFLAHVRRRGGLGDKEGEATVLAEDEDVVRIMSVHQAKGLEFPVVIHAGLGDMVREDNRGLLVGAEGEVALRMTLPGKFNALKSHITLGPYEQLLQQEREQVRMEEARICYVAATRAQERLILVGARAPLLRQAEKRPLTWFMSAVGLGAEADVPVASRPWDDVDLVCNPSVRSACSTAPDVTGREKAAGVVLSPVAPPVFPALTRAPSTSAVSFSALKLFHLCPRRYYVERVLGFRAETALNRPGDSLPAVASAANGAQEGEWYPRGLREPDEEGEPQRLEMGIVVHKMLELAPLGAHIPAEGLLCELYGAATSMLGVSLPQRAGEECRALCAAYWRSPLARLGGDTLGREVSFAFAVGARLVKGVMDRVEVSRETWHIIDYKTNLLCGRSALQASAAYHLQVVIYGLLGLRRGADRVYVHLLFLEAPEEPVSVAYGPGDMAQLEERLRAEVVALETSRFERAAAECPACPHNWMCGVTRH
ncbi:MAG: UvrD-helicase domain-containing protein [Gaiellales bacterium]|nr:UvrD-helicase domain-containing protein [Gaiellales bacterium]